MNYLMVFSITVSCLVLYHFFLNGRRVVVRNDYIFDIRSMRAEYEKRIAELELKYLKRIAELEAQIDECLKFIASQDEI